ncbi:integrase [Arthrobacter globiformis]|nr:integrase [Arthrobacter globiformis]
MGSGGWPFRSEGRIPWLRAVVVAFGRAVNTQKAYQLRLARFLSWCAETGTAWTGLRFHQLAAYKACLEGPYANGGRLSGKTVNAHLTAVMVFLRYAVAHGFATDLWATVEGGRPGADSLKLAGQWKMAPARLAKAREIKRRPVVLTLLQADRILDAVDRPRDRLLVLLMLRCGLRAGEALGLRLEDMHMLPDSGHLGCTIPGPHVHIERRSNPNGAWAKSPYERNVPVPADVCEVHSAYMAQRYSSLGATSPTQCFCLRPVRARRRWDTRGFTTCSRLSGRPRVCRSGHISSGIPQPPAGRGPRSTRMSSWHCWATGPWPRRPFISPRAGGASKRGGRNAAEPGGAAVTAAADFLRRESPVPEAGSYLAFLESMLEHPWRSGEWDARLWLFATDPDHPLTGIYACPTPGCPRVATVTGRLCRSCTGGEPGAEPVPTRRRDLDPNPPALHSRLSRAGLPGHGHDQGTLQPALRTLAPQLGQRTATAHHRGLRRGGE